MIARNLLILCLSGLWFLFGSWYYTCKIMHCSCAAPAATTAAASAAAATAVVPAVKAETGPILFNYANSSPVTNQDFGTFKQGLIAKMTNDNKLEITGHYFKNETNTSKLKDMGLARATAAKALFLDKVPENRIVLKSQMVNERDGVKDQLFNASSFQWLAVEKKAPVEETKIIEVDNKALIYFPFKSTEKISNAKIDAYLNKLALRLKQTKETISITGHTDNIGTPADNLTLGKNRADRIKQLLVQKGIDAKRIQTFTKGESQPIGNNNTDAGRQQNRRTELLIK